MNEGGLWKGSISLSGSSMRGTWRVILSMALEMGVCFHRGPVLGNMGERSFPRAFERMVKLLFFIRRTFMRNSRDM